MEGSIQSDNFDLVNTYFGIYVVHTYDGIYVTTQMWKEGFISVFYVLSHKKILYCLFYLKIAFLAGTMFVTDVTLTTVKYKYTHYL